MANKRVLEYELMRHPFISSYNMYGTAIINEFSHGVIHCKRPITIDEKLQLMDCIGHNFSGPIDGQRDGNNLVLFNSDKFSYFRTENKKYKFVAKGE